MLNTRHITVAGLVIACGTASAAPEAGRQGKSDRIAIGIPTPAVPIQTDGKSGGKGGYFSGGINCATMTRIARARQQLLGNNPGLRANINLGNVTQEPWDVQLNGEALIAGNRQYEPFALWVDDNSIIAPGTPTEDVYPGTNVLVPYRICKESWFDDPLDIDVMPPIENSDPPFPGFPFEGMEVSDETEQLILEAIQVIQAAADITFVEVEPREQPDAAPRGTPMLLFVTGATAEEPFDSDQFLDGDGASFSISVGMLTGPVCMIGPYDLGDASGFNTAAPFNATPWAIPTYYFQLLDEEEIPTDDMGNFITLPGWDPMAHPSIPAGRLPILDVDDLDEDGVAADLGDDMNPGAMWVDWEPRPFMDRRFQGAQVEDLNGIEDLGGDGVYTNTDGNTTTGFDAMEGIEISPFTNLIVLHPDLGEGGAGPRSVIIHEIMHAIGFFHEHQRNDRDDFVEILEQNVAPGQLGQFSKQPPGTEFGDYDFESIMHYGPTAFSGNGQVTIDVLDEWEARFGNVIGTALTLSRGDAAALRELYGARDCPEDLDGDFKVDLDDWQLFIGFFVDNDFRADVNTDGVVDVGDIIDFLQAFAGRTCFSPPPQPPVLPGFNDVTDPF